MTSRPALRFLLALAAGTTLLPAQGTVPPDYRRTLVLLISGQSYEIERTLPVFAARFLNSQFRVVTVTGAMINPSHRFDDFEAVAAADVLVISVWRRSPPREQLDQIRRHVAAGKPIVGIATASHAFAPRRNMVPGPGQAGWPEWDAEAIGGNYTGHHPGGLITTVRTNTPDHPLLAGVDLPFTSRMELNKVSPLDPRAQPILIGTLAGRPPEPVAWTFIRQDGGKSFFTPLGHPEDFENPSFQRLLLNATRWAAE
jgi:type 1 glutamine amidotransferase